MQVKDIIIEIIKTILEDESVDNVLLTDDNLVQLNINSIDFIRLVVELERRFDIEFEDEALDYTKFTSLTLLCDYVEKRIREQNA